jgi:hypothetical protein
MYAWQGRRDTCSSTENTSQIERGTDEATEAVTDICEHVNCPHIIQSTRTDVEISLMQTEQVG